MKTVILAGGFGTRITEESQYKPKPMIEIGEYPILWHIMKIYSHYGFNDFIIPLGYKGYVIKEYFANYFMHNSDVTIDLSNNSLEVHNSKSEPWKITLVDTGLDTLTGGRIKKIQKYIGDEPFMLTYGDGVADINIAELVEFHKQHKKIATITAVQPTGRFGSLNLSSQDEVIRFQEKPENGNAWINGGFFVLEPQVFDYIDGNVLWEKTPVDRLSQENQLVAYRHSGFWKPMDTLRDKHELESLWNSDQAKWKVW
jgi:glucose-1-phosphate cytidylyltransferase